MHKHLTINFSKLTLMNGTSQNKILYSYLGTDGVILLKRHFRGITQKQKKARKIKERLSNERKNTSLFFLITVKQFIHHTKGKDFIAIYMNEPKLPNQRHELLFEST